MSDYQIIDIEDQANLREMLSGSGYSDKAISYYLDKPYMGSLTDADIVSEMTGTCGDTMKIFIKMNNGCIEKASYQVLGCAGAVSSAMTVVDLIKGKSIENAKSIDDGDIFRVLKAIPSKKHHCIQLAVKTLHKALDEYEHKERG